MSGYVGDVQRLLIKLMVLLAILLMPFGMAPLSASPPHNAPMAGMPMGHCPDQEPGRSTKSGIAECTMACAAALPAIDVSAGEPLLIVSELARPSPVQRLRGLRPDPATPPPRFS